MITILTLSLFSINQEVVILDENFKKMWINEIKPVIDNGTLSIILNNLFVVFALWLFSAVPKWVYRRRPRRLGDKKKLVSIIYIIYILYFIKEGVRVGLNLLGWNYTSYGFALLTLILPHGIVEIGAFALTGALAFNWATSLNRFELPKIRSFIVPIILIIFSGVLETTLTPYIFKTFL